MATVITGLFENPSTAAQAVRQLETRGVPASNISIVASESVKRESFAIDSHSKAGEGTAIGAGLGGAIGALIAGFTAVGAIATGGIGLIAAGPLVAALAGAGAGAAAGSVVGAAVGFAIPEHEVKFYDDALRKGSVLVGVQCDNDSQRTIAKEVFEARGAKRVSNA
jgi:hypothetical protein